jgi:hypothetical protein
MEVENWLELLRTQRILNERDIRLLCLKVSEVLIEVSIKNNLLF